MMTGENAQTSQLTVVDHPLVADRNTRLRDASTPSDDFRRLIHQLTLLVLPHALSDLAVRQVEVTTPLETTSGARLSNDVMFVGILRAALTMVGAALEIVPEASVGYLGLERDHTTHLANEYYNKVPQTDGSTRHPKCDVLRDHRLPRRRCCRPRGSPEYPCSAGCGRPAAQRKLLHLARLGRCRRPQLPHLIRRVTAPHTDFGQRPARPASIESIIPGTSAIESAV